MIRDGQGFGGGAQDGIRALLDSLERDPKKLLRRDREEIGAEAAGFSVLVEKLLGNEDYRSIDLREHLAKVEQRKTELGLIDTPERTRAMRNKGWNRTPEKRELLRRAGTRAAVSGEPDVMSRNNG